MQLFTYMVQKNAAGRVGAFVELLGRKRSYAYRVTHQVLNYILLALICLLARHVTSA